MVASQLDGSGEQSHETADITPSANDHPVAKLPDVDEVRHDVLTIGFDAALRSEERASIDTASDVFEHNVVAARDHIRHFDAPVREAGPPIVDVFVPAVWAAVDESEWEFDPLSIFCEEACSSIQIVVGDRLQESEGLVTVTNPRLQSRAFEGSGRGWRRLGIGRVVQRLDQLTT